MNLNLFLEESMDDEMQPYLDSDEYRSRHSSISEKISEFKSGLTSKAQQEQFDLLMNLISEEHSDYAVEAYTSGFKAGTTFREQVMEK